MLVNFDNVAHEHIELISKYRVLGYDKNHLVQGTLSFWVPDDEIPIQEVIKLHHQGVHFQHLVAYILITSSSLESPIPVELGYSMQKWGELVSISSLDGTEHIGYTNTPNGTTTVEQLMILEGTPEIELLSVAEYQYRTHNIKWRTFESGESTEFFTIQKINQEWFKYFDDYTIARDTMKSMMVSMGGFEALSSIEQKIVARWKCVPSTEIFMVLNQYEMAASESIFQKNSKEANIRRVGLCQYILKNAVAPLELPHIIRDLTQHNLIESFTDRLVRGTQSMNHDGIPDSTGILDYINSTSTFSTTGFKTQNTTMINGYTKEQLCTMLTNMIEKGRFN